MLHEREREMGERDGREKREKREIHVPTDGEREREKEREGN